jgi:hypothetical protein
MGPPAPAVGEVREVARGQLVTGAGRKLERTLTDPATGKPRPLSQLDRDLNPPLDERGIRSSNHLLRRTLVGVDLSHVSEASAGVVEARSLPRGFGVGELRRCYAATSSDATRVCSNCGAVAGRCAPGRPPTDAPISPRGWTN